MLAVESGDIKTAPRATNSGATATKGCGPLSRTQDTSDGTCQCLCGGKTAPGARFIRGHHKRKPSTENLDGLYAIEDRGYSSPCWIYGCVKRDGYGRMTYRGRSLLAHRAMYEIHIGPIADGLQLDHLCENRACVNPSHLEAVTPAENTRRGKSTKLTVEKVAAIKARLPHEPTARLAAEYGVHRTTVQAIEFGRSWKDVQPTGGSDE